MAQVGIVFYGTADERKSAVLSETRHAGIARALENVGATPVPAVYNDAIANEFFEQVSALDGILVWVNPVMPDGHGRSKLDGLLRDLATQGVMVSAHPDVILKMGTKQVLYETRDCSFGSDVRVYRTHEELRKGLPRSLERGNARVLKQYRGHSGGGIYRIQLQDTSPQWTINTLVRIRHAERGSIEHPATLEDVFELFEHYFQNEGRMIDQEYQDRLTDGMIRCYLVADKIQGFGHQAINALYPAPDGGRPEDAPQPGPRLYYPANQPEFQVLRKRMEDEFLPQLLKTLSIRKEELPLLWDADFLFGPKDEDGCDTYVLCEINVSSVAPFPESAERPLADATLGRLQQFARK